MESIGHGNESRILYLEFCIIELLSYICMILLFAISVTRIFILIYNIDFCVRLFSWSYYGIQFINYVHL